MTPNDLAFVLALILQLLDVLTTRAGLRKGLGEANPAIRRLMEAAGDGWGIWKFVAGSAIILPLWLFADAIAPWGAVGLWTVVAGMAGLVLWNLRLIRRA